MQGYGQQANETTGELLKLELETLQNEECYNTFLNISETFFFNSTNQSTGRKKEITMDIKRALYDGITDQLLCTVVTCNGTDSSLDRLDKCVSNVCPIFYKLSVEHCKIRGYLSYKFLYITIKNFVMFIISIILLLNNNFIQDAAPGDSGAPL